MPGWGVCGCGLAAGAAACCAEGCCIVSSAVQDSTNRGASLYLNHMFCYSPIFSFGPNYRTWRRRGMSSVPKLVAIAFTASLLVASGRTLLQGQAQQGASISAVAGQKGGWDVTGPYDVVRDWPKPLSALPGHEN
jgi:hypothetical protein